MSRGLGRTGNQILRVVASWHIKKWFLSFDLLFNFTHENKNLPLTNFTRNINRFCPRCKSQKRRSLLDGKAFLKYEKLTIVEYSIKDLTGNEFLSLQIKESPTTHASYLVLYFTEAKRRIESTSIDRISGMGSKSMIEKLIT